ncbi:unnamed protein product [Urochloa humidicola]
MAPIVISASKGVIGPLLDKLTEMINFIGVSKDIVLLRDELRTLNALLEKLEDTDELGPLVKAWRDKIREMGYDIEDFIDDFLHRAGNGGANAVFIDEVSLFIKTLRDHFETAKHVKELKTHLKEINEQSKRYKFGESVLRSGSVAIDRRLSALYSDEANLVGVEGPREDVIKLLTDSMDQQLKVLSIVGFGGLGKTTLSKEVYYKIEGQFDVMAFISVSRRPDIRRLLHDIQSELGMRESPSTFNVKFMIEDIRKHLQLKRYIVVLDDLWDAPTWDMICSAFPENGMGNLVIVTARKEDVASGGSNNYRHLSYKMKPLTEHESRILFSRRMFGSENHCPYRFREVSDEILSKCCGIPLAIILIARLLANRPSLLRKEWEDIRDSIGIQESGANPTWERMRQILYLSYKDLPLHLRTCFLYLGIYPEDSEIYRNELIRQWVAEGFVHHSHGQNLEDVAKSYFSELINRSLIEPANTNYGEVVSCRVHDVILGFILTLCTESNFISVACTLEEMTGQHQYKTRRLLLGPRIGDTGYTDTAISGTTSSISLSHIRSLRLFGEFLPVLASKYLRVLILETERVDLTAIGQFFKLRYLNVSAGAIELPTEIQGLQYLVTFQIFCMNGITLPPDIFGLPRLSHLIVPISTRLPDGIGKTKSLCTLSGFDISDFHNVNDLGVLTNLRDLNLYTTKQVLITDTKIDALATSLAKLCNLRNLCICSVGQWTHDVNGRLGSLSHHPPFHIEKLELIRWLLPRVPRWISGDLRHLIRLNLSVKETSTDEVRILGELPSLNDLYLWVQNCSQERGPIIEFGPLGFPALEHLRLYCGGDVLSCLRFETGVMPSLKKLTVSYIDSEWSGNAPVGIEHLLNLREIQLFPYSDSGTVESDRMRAFTEVIEAHGRLVEVFPVQPFECVTTPSEGRPQRTPSQ